MHLETQSSFLQVLQAQHVTYYARIGFDMLTQAIVPYLKAFLAAYAACSESHHKTQIAQYLSRDNPYSSTAQSLCAISVSVYNSNRATISTAIRFCSQAHDKTTIATCTQYIFPFRPYLFVALLVPT